MIEKTRKHQIHFLTQRAIDLLCGTIYSTSMTRTTIIDKTEKVGITLPVTLAKRVAKVRGDIPRSTYIRRSVERYLQGKTR
jgi:hypothetical protein